MSTLEQLCTVLDRLGEEATVPGIAAVRTLIQGDRDAEALEFPSLVLAPDHKTLKDLRAAVVGSGLDNAPHCLAPYREIEQWTDADLTAVDRARMVVAATTAQQLVSRALAQIMEQAGIYMVPVLVYVTGMRRARDPSGIATEAPGHISRTVTRAQVHVTCIGDDRYQGPSLLEALESQRTRLDGNNALQDRRRSVLLGNRTQRVRELVLDAQQEVDVQLRMLREEADLLRDTQRAHQLLAKADAHVSARSLVLLREAIISINVGNVEARARKTAGRPAAKSYVAAFGQDLKDEVVAALKGVRKQVCSQVVDAHAALLTRLVSDITQASNDASKVAPAAAGSRLDSDPVLRILREDLDRTLDGLERSSCDLVDPTAILSGLLGMLRKLSKVDPGQHNESKDHEKAEPNAPAKSRRLQEPSDKVPSEAQPDEPEPQGKNDQPEENRPDLWTRFEPYLERIEAGHLRSQAERILQAIADHIDDVIAATGQRWEYMLSETITTTFTRLGEAVRDARSTLQEKQARITVLEGEIDS